MSDSTIINNFIDQEHRIRQSMGEELWQKERGPQYLHKLKRLTEKYGLSLANVVRSGQHVTFHEDGSVDIVRKGNSLD